MLKAILGVRMTTVSDLLYIELGVCSIKTQVLMKQLKFGKKVMELDDADPLAYVVSEAKRYKMKEIKHYEQLLMSFTTVHDIKKKFTEDTKARIRSNAEKSRSKYKTYLTINPDLESPRVFEKLYQHKDISMISKLRVSSHNLQIEMGRRTGTKVEDRKCHCGEVEDEQHFLLHCNTYLDIRNKYNIQNTNITKILDDSKFIQYIEQLYLRRSEANA